MYAADSYATTGSLAIGGNLQNQGRPRRPNIASYATVQEMGPQVLPFSAQDFADLFGSRVLKFRANHDEFLVERATRFSFFESLAEPTWTLQIDGPVDALGFIGHSVVEQDRDPKYSVGIAFFDRDLIKQRGTLPGDEQWVNLVRGSPAVAAQYAFYAPQVRSQTKVLFFAACDISPEFKSLWGIDENTVGRAMIVPQGQVDVFLNQGANAWINIAESLSNGRTVGQAVNDWNNSPAPGTLFTVVGDSNVRITGPARP